MSVQSEGLQTVLRKEELNPARAMFIGEVPEFGDCLIQMGETVSVPVDYFGPQLRQTDDLAASPDDRYLFATKNGDRFGRLTDTRAALLRNKLAAYWSQIRI
jgi:hypothetical protein